MLDFLDKELLRKAKPTRGEIAPTAAIKRMRPPDTGGLIRFSNDNRSLNAN